MQYQPKETAVSHRLVNAFSHNPMKVGWPMAFAVEYANRQAIRAPYL